MHLWMARLPSGLPDGIHRLSITSTDRHGRTYTDELVFEVRPERLPARFRTDVWNAGAGN